MGRKQVLVDWHQDKPYRDQSKSYLGRSIEPESGPGSFLDRYRTPMADPIISQTMEPQRLEIPEEATLVKVTIYASPALEEILLVSIPRFHAVPTLPIEALDILIAPSSHAADQLRYVDDESGRYVRFIGAGTTCINHGVDADGVWTLEVSPLPAGYRFSKSLFPEDDHPYLR